MIELAAAAVAMVSPYLVEAAHEAGKAVGKSAGESAGKVLGWMKEKMTPRGKEALGELEQQPSLASNQDDVRVQLTKLLEQQPELAKELEALLGSAQGGQQYSQTVGAGGKANFTVGSGNTSSIS